MKNKERRKFKYQKKVDLKEFELFLQELLRTGSGQEKKLMLNSILQNNIIKLKCSFYNREEVKKYEGFLLEINFHYTYYFFKADNDMSYSSIGDMVTLERV